MRGRYLVNGKRKDVLGAKTEQRLEIGQQNKAHTITSVSKDSMLGIIQTPRGKNKGGIHTEKSPTLTCNSFEHNNKLIDGMQIRKLTPKECERLQGLPDGYTEGVSNTQRYKACGNAFNVDVVAHILSFIQKDNNHAPRR